MRSLFLLLIFTSCLVFAFACGPGCDNCYRRGGGGRDNNWNNNQWYCSKCYSGYNLWSAKCYACAAGKFFHEGICYGCDSPCATCSQGGRCASCSSSTGYPLAYGGYCYQSCPQSTFQLSSTACQGCPSYCASCTSSSNCLACQSGRYFYQNLCYAVCPAGTYGDTDFHCKPCTSICGTCRSLTSCQSCVAPHMLYNSYCHDPCPSGSYPNGQVCSKCPTGCSTCTSATYCSTCQYGYYFKDNFCYATCPTRSYGNSNYQCLNCPNGCSSCTGPNNCLGCDPNYFFLNYKCESSCPAKTFADPPRCSNCLPRNSSCSGSRQCNGCLSPYVVNGNVCTSSSPGSFTSCYQNIPGCQACIDSMTCLYCTPDGYLYQNKCYTSCFGNTFDRDHICYDCLPYCKICTDETSCQECVLGYYLFQNNQCLATCPYGYYGSYGSSGSCQVCPTNCASCTSAYFCTSCKDNYLLSTGSCVVTCPPGTYNVLGVCTSCSAHCINCGEGAICSACETSWMLLNNKCYDVCPDGYYKENGACQVCPAGCTTCTDANTCGSCDQDHVFYQNTCLFKCPDGMYNATGFCEDCMAGCRICESDIACLQCAVGYVYFNHSCPTTCPDGYYNLDGICTNCPIGCTTCTSALLCQSCAYGYNIHMTDVCALDITEEEIAAVKGMAKTTEATGTASNVISSIYGFLNSGDPTAMFMGSLAKMLQYVKYINIDYPPKIKLMFGLQSNVNDTSESIITKTQKKIEDTSDSPQLASNFGYYKLTSSFMSNCFQSLGILAGIITGIGVTYLMLYLISPSSKIHRACKSLIGILKWNLFLLMFCGMVGDIVFFSSFEFRKAKFDNAFSVVSFVTCILMNCLSIFIFYKLVQVNMSLQKTRDKAGSMENTESRWESCKVFFQSYKNKKFCQQAFMIFFLTRVLSFYLIIAYFSAYPFFQIIMITVISFLIVIYLIIIRPFKSVLNNINQVVFELIIFAFNGCILVLAALDTSKSGNYPLRKKLETVLLNINLAAGFVSTLFVVLKVLVLLVDAYKEWKLAKEAKNPRRQKLQNPRLTSNTLKISNNLATNQNSLWTLQDTSSQNIINLDTMTVMNMDQTSYDFDESKNINSSHINKKILFDTPSSGYERSQFGSQSNKGNQGMSLAELQSNTRRIKNSSTLTSKRIKKRPTHLSNVANQILKDGGSQIVEEKDQDLGNQMPVSEFSTNQARIRRRQNHPKNNGRDIIGL